MFNVDEILRLKEAGFTAEEIREMATQPDPQPTDPDPQPTDPVPQPTEPLEQPKKADVWEEVNKAMFSM